MPDHHTHPDPAVRQRIAEVEQERDRAEQQANNWSEDCLLMERRAERAEAALAEARAEGAREALLEAADDLEGRLGTTPAPPRDLWEFRFWLRDRAERIGGDQ